MSSRERVEKTFLSEIDNNREIIHSIGKKIWDYSEIGYKEIKSSKLLMDSFEEFGFEVERGLVGIDPKFKNKIEMPTAFTATYAGEEEGLTIGVLLEYDALPNGHACGHNLISSAGFAASIGLKEAIKQVGGKVIAFGTPAEELDGAKPYLLAANYMDEVDIMLACHGGKEWNSEVVVKSLVWPTHDDKLTFRGVASHASAAPEKGRSALDAAIITGMGLEFLREHMVETNRIHYIFSNGGDIPNSVPDFAQVDLELRANDAGELHNLMDRVDNIIKGATLMTGTEAIYKWDSPWYSATPVPSLYKHVAETAEDLGVDKNLFTFGSLPQASSDVGSIGYEIPTFEVTFPVKECFDDIPDTHTDEFSVVSNTEYARDQSILAGKLMALASYRILEDKKLYENIVDEFNKNYIEINEDNRR